MAERKTTTRKTTSAPTGKSHTKSAAAKSRSKKQAELEAKRIQEEALARSLQRRRTASIVLCAFGIVLFLLAVIPGTAGWNMLYQVMHGLFGFSSYLVGPFMIYIAVVLSKEYPTGAITARILRCVLFVLIICAGVEIFGVGKINGEKFGELVKNLYEGGRMFKGGGFFALFLGEPLLLLGKLGAGIIIVVIALASILLLTKMTLSEIGGRLTSAAKTAGGAAADYRERRRAEREITNEQYRIAQEERRAAQQAEKERKRAALEEQREEREKARMERMRNALDSVEKSGIEKPAEQANVPEPKPAASPVLAPAQSEVKPQPAPEPPVQTAAAADEDDTMLMLKQYMEKKHPIMREEEKKDPLEDENAELVPIVDALRKFNEDHSRPARVSKIMDAPKSDITTSAAANPLTDAVSDTDEAELPFDIDDIIPEKQEQSYVTDDRPVPPFSKVFENMQGNTPQLKAPEPPARKHAPAPQEKQLTLADVYSLPPVSLLNPVKQRVPQADIETEIRTTAHKLVDTLKSFGVETTYTGAARGPSVTRYELQLAPGVKISKIQNLSEDIALHIGASGVRIAPVPEKAAVGIEVPNSTRETVFFRELVDTPEFRKSYDKKLLSVLGKDISGASITCNVSKMPHLLIAGTTGSGKSVCVNSIIMSILMKSTPSDVRLIMVDPKQVEFMMYNGIPHLLIPVVTDPKKAAGALAWAVTEMENRYTLFSENNVRNIDGYNALADDPNNALQRMPQIVIFIDELADLMMASPKDVEDSIVRLAQKARAAGMNLVIATQKPTVQVVTGLIKGNIPSRIALMVASQIDSRVILDSSGAEKLLGNGDMLYQPVGVPKPIRLQGCYVSDDEVERVVEFIKQTFSVEYDESIIAEIERVAEAAEAVDAKPADDGDDEYDEKLEEAIELVVSAGAASTSALQRKLGLGFSRAGRIMDQLEKLGVVGPTQGSKPRQVLMTKQEWYERKLRN